MDVVESIVVKASFLGCHPTLFQVYKALVDTNLMTDAEFWRIRQNELEMERVNFKNRKGTQVQNQTRYALTAHLREQLLSALPHLKKLLSREDLWEEFFSSRTYGDASKLSSHFDHNNGDVNNNREVVLDAEYIARKLSSLVASENDRFEGFGNREGEYFEEPKITSALMHEINLQSVQQVPPLGNLRTLQAATPRADIVIPDLTEDLYFENEMEISNLPEKETNLYTGPLWTTIDSKEFHDSKLESDLDEGQLIPLTPFPSSQLLLGNNNNQQTREEEKKVEAPHQEHIVALAQTVTEVLKHFWSALPPMTVEKRQIVIRMIDILDVLEKEYQHWHVRITLKDQIIVDQILQNSIWEPVKRARQVYQEVCQPQKK